MTTVMLQKMIIWLLAIAAVLAAAWPDDDNTDHEIENDEEEWIKLPTKFSREDNNEVPAYGWTNITEFEEWVIRTRPDLWEPDEEMQ